MRNAPAEGDDLRQQPNIWHYPPSDRTGLMVQFKPSLPVASASGPIPTIAVNNDGWANLEKALQAHIPAEARAEIVAVTNGFLGHAVFSEAETVDVAAKRLGEVSRAAVAFWQTLVDQNNSDASIYVDTLIERGLADELIGSDRKIDKISKLMTDFVGACNDASRLLRVAAVPHIKLNEYWDDWIRKVVFIFKRNSLPTTARKDTDKNKLGPSPFVTFVSEFQKFLPAIYARGKQSESALAELIVKAKRSIRVSKRSSKTGNKTRPKP